MKKLLIVLLFTTHSYALELDKVAHFGISYAIQTGMYGLVKTSTKLDKPKAVLLSFALTVVATSMKEFLIDKRADPRDIQANALGALSASATILVFDF